MSGPSPSVKGSVVITFLHPVIRRVPGHAILALSILVAGDVAAAQPSRATVAPAEEKGLLLGPETLYPPEPDAAIGLVDAADGAAPGSDTFDGSLRSVVGQPLAGIAEDRS